MKERRPQDSAYKYLFSNKRIFHQLITQFVDLGIAKKISLDSIQQVDRSFIADDLKKRESDLIYQVNLQGQELYIYILVEFQSKPDKTIPIRMLLYILHLYDLIYRNSQAGKLPAILPILLYNGKEEWTIPFKIEELINKHLPSRFIPRFSYYPIIEKNLPPAKLNKLKGLVSAVFYLENQNNPEKLAEAIDHVIHFLDKEQPEELRMFTCWVNEIFRGTLKKESIEKIRNLTEVKSMLSEVVDQMIDKEKQIGIQEGMQKGIQKGIQKGLQKGMQKGMEKGLEKGVFQGKIEDARKMLNKGFSMKDIEEITGLTREILRQISRDKI